MNCHRGVYVVVCVAVAMSYVQCGWAAGFNPQPEPPGKWYVEGYIDMWTLAVDPTGTEMPFGIDRDIVGDAVADFSAGVIARFDAPSTVDSKPTDGLYDVEFEYFRLRIGDTAWDETMPGTIQFHVFGGEVNDCWGVVTVTMPEHPDLSFELAASPGTWNALDERDDVDLGVVTGTYSLRDGKVPEPATACLLALLALSLPRRRGLALMRRRA